MSPRDTKSATSLSKAQAKLSRAVDKCESFKRAGTFVVVDPSGAPVSAVRMDGCAPGALPLVRAKAFGAAANGEPSAQFAARMAKFGGPVFAVYQAVLRDQPFPGAGGMLIKEGDRVTGAIATGLGIGPFIKSPGVAPTAFLADGEPANLEDIIISYALDTPYNPQHGDDRARWIEAYGSPPDPGLKGVAMDPAPSASRQPVLTRARAISDHVLDLAAARDARVSVVIVDAAGDPITLDRMDGAPPMGVDVAQAVAIASVNFAIPSSEIAAHAQYGGSLDRLMDTVPFRMLALPGAHPLGAPPAFAGAVGVHCQNLELAQELARAAAEWSGPRFEGDQL